MACVGETNETLLDDLLALLDGYSEEDAVSGAPASSGKRDRRRARKIGPSTQDVLESLRVEASQLTEELGRLLRDGRTPRHVAMERALTERRKRQRTEQECETLRDAVYKHTKFVRGLDAIVCFRPRFSLRLNLCRYLHRHIVLPRERSARWGSLEAASHHTRMQLAMEVLCHETATLSLSEEHTAAGAPPPEPKYHCETVDDGCGNNSVTHTSVYTVDIKDLGAVVRGVCVAIRDIVTICPFGHSNDVTDDLIDADVPTEGNLLYRVVSVNHLDANSNTPIRLQTHVLTSFRMTDDYAVVLYDYVDEDELHPKPETTEISREATGACLIRRKMCSDGVERTVLLGWFTLR